MILQDGFNRKIESLRISITDRCNLKCNYCMPKNPSWIPHSEILTFEEIIRIAKIMAGLGIKKIRITGGEPLIRKDCIKLISMLKNIDNIKDISLTTNGILLKEMAKELHEVGLRRINVSLDTLNRKKLINTTGQDILDNVIEGLEEANRAGFKPIKVNTVIIRGFNDDEITDFAIWAKTKPYQIRFIEFMPHRDNDWHIEKVVTAQEIVEKISKICNLIPIPNDTGNPAKRYRFADGVEEIGIISAVSSPFCTECNRIRLTADGKLITCLFSSKETDLKIPLRSGKSDKEIAYAIIEAVKNKERGHLISTSHLEKAARAMHSIGG